jgi:hypothetical protein
MQATVFLEERFKARAEKGYHLSATPILRLTAVAAQASGIQI